MNIYTGIDIIEVARIKENIEKYGEHFLNKVYTEKEIEYCESKKTQKFQTYAGRFATKEAVFKAVSTLLENKFDIGWQDIEVLNSKEGRPFVIIQNEVLANNLNLKIDISISHIESVACASVVANICK